MNKLYLLQLMNFVTVYASAITVSESPYSMIREQSKSFPHDKENLRTGHTSKATSAPSSEVPKKSLFRYCYESGAEVASIASNTAQHILKAAKHTSIAAAHIILPIAEATEGGFTLLKDKSGRARSYAWTKAQAEDTKQLPKAGMYAFAGISASTEIISYTIMQVARFAKFASNLVI